MDKERMPSKTTNKAARLFTELEERILRFGLDSEPASANVVAKRLQMKETPKNVAVVRDVLEKLIKEKKVYKSGSRYAIDHAGGMNLMKTFCVKVSDENYKIDNYIFDQISSH